MTLVYNVKENFGVHMAPDEIIRMLQEKYFSIKFISPRSMVHIWINDNINGNVYYWNQKYYFQYDDDRLHFILRWINNNNNKTI